MSNTTIKTYTEITPLEALKLLVENDGHPLKGLSFKDHPKNKWIKRTLNGISLREDVNYRFTASGQGWENCAKVTELDPCVAPDGCAELEPWMAYVGDEAFPLPEIVDQSMKYFACFSINDGWQSDHGPYSDPYRAIDVRTAWSKEHFPIHCRIRNYQEPDAFEEFVKDEELNWRGSAEYSLAKRAYELGQANPQAK